MSTALETFEGVGGTIEEALAAAHRQILPREGRDFTTSRVVDWGMQFGGFVGETLFYVRVVEDRDASFKTRT
ncbi:hypothetical protein JOH52_006747 [Sinorhizobium meliloti]|uniref:hypothetical protein n=1 Tax=Rhizobium meliloti TaxID=382 RepID=UPI0003747215|nr:hypothetical protein [Sinorhizobium meliloti]MBP2470655.1 hypothetical protein [Sinorhizobium meliloti]MDE3786138.1 hypothetical protein [Sinorhizobium meliloti]MDE4550492.1 hypothetical protein [Sinorhizobium meliloti]MDE4598088.1 hypothetical protein [Sinorhizobium meliloti]MQW78861.1 hypothetical protein [Sinorhizobium meliloti]